MLERRVLHVYSRPTVGQRRERNNVKYMNNNMFLFFYGEFTDETLDRMPDENGIYIVYKVRYNEIRDEYSGVLYYIGQSKKVKTRIREHLTDDDFNDALSDGYELWYTYAKVANQNSLDAIENALIYTQQPEKNVKLKDSYNYGPISIIACGYCPLVHKYINLSINLKVRTLYSERSS